MSNSFDKLGTFGEKELWVSSGEKRALSIGRRRFAGNLQELVVSPRQLKEYEVRFDNKMCDSNKLDPEAPCIVIVDAKDT